MTAEKLLEEIAQLLSNRKYDEATDVAYIEIYHLAITENYEELSHLFFLANPKSLGSSISRSLLSLTVNFKDKILYRESFKKRAFKHISRTQSEDIAERLVYAIL